MSKAASYRLLAVDIWRRSNDPADSDFGPELLAQTLADAEQRAITDAVRWLYDNGHKSAAVALEARGKR